MNEILIRAEEHDERIGVECARFVHYGVPHWDPDVECWFVEDGEWRVYFDDPKAILVKL